MRQAFSGHETELGFEIERRQGRRRPAVTMSDLIFADDLALLASEIDEAQEMLSRVETEAAKVGLHVNAKKTELMSFNYNHEVEIKTIEGKSVKKVKSLSTLVPGWLPQNMTSQFAKH